MSKATLRTFVAVFPLAMWIMAARCIELFMWLLELEHYGYDYSSSPPDWYYQHDPSFWRIPLGEGEWVLGLSFSLITTAVVIGAVTVIRALTLAVGRILRPADMVAVTDTYAEEFDRHECVECKDRYCTCGYHHAPPTFDGYLLRWVSRCKDPSCTCVIHQSDDEVFDIPTYEWWPREDIPSVSS